MNQFLIDMHSRYSPAQQATRLRNDRIRRLRGLYANTWLLDADLQPVVQAAVDAQLSRLDAQPEGIRRAEDMQAMREGKGYYKGYGKRRKFVEFNK